MESLRGPINSLQAVGGSVDISNYTSFLSCNQDPFLQMLQEALQVAELKVAAKEELQKDEVRVNISSFLPPAETHSELLFRLHHNLKQELAVAEAAEPVDSCVTNASPPNAGDDEEILVRIGKRKRSTRKVAVVSPKSVEEAESQRMTHIAVERNRRRLMNHHLATLRALMPSSYVPRGDQASIVGGAIEFVKELEQLLLSLQAEKRWRAATEVAVAVSSSTCSSAASSPCTTLSRSTSVNEEQKDAAAATAGLGGKEADIDGFFVAPQYTNYTQGNGLPGVDVEVTVVQGHVSLKVAGTRIAGQLAHAVAALEELRLPVLHLTVTSVGASTVLYSFNLKMEEDCKLVAPDEIAASVQRIFA